jgi:serine/threonine protein kinase
LSAPHPRFDSAGQARKRALGQPLADGGDLYLPLGTRLASYEVRGVIGHGGMSVVYLAVDPADQRQVAVKEYFPMSLARRVGTDVIPLGEAQAELFDLGRLTFLKEAQLLGRLRHPTLVQVYRVWEQHRTAYFAMAYSRGKTLAQYVASLPGAPTEKWLRKVLRWVLEGLDVVHQAGCVHRDISPANVMLQHDGNPLLLDFGSARSLAPHSTLPLASFVTPGYSPIEQYDLGELGAGTIEGLAAEGPWTDLYSLAGTLYCALTGEPPVPAPLRTIKDTQRRLAEVKQGTYDARLLKALDHALEVLPARRPQSAAEMARLAGIEFGREAANMPPAREPPAGSTGELTFGGFTPQPLGRTVPMRSPATGEIGGPGGAASTPHDDFPATVLSDELEAGAPDEDPAFAPTQVSELHPTRGAADETEHDGSGFAPTMPMGGVHPAPAPSAARSPLAPAAAASTSAAPSPPLQPSPAARSTAAALSPVARAEKPAPAPLPRLDPALRRPLPRVRARRRGAVLVRALIVAAALGVTGGLLALVLDWGGVRGQSPAPAAATPAQPAAPAAEPSASQPQG